MRMLFTIGLPTPHFNKLVADGTAGAILKEILDTQKPEAVYFTETQWRAWRDPHCRCPRALSRARAVRAWFLKFNATVESRTVMGPADLAKGDLESIGKHWGHV